MIIKIIYYHFCSEYVHDQSVGSVNICVWYAYTDECVNIEHRCIIVSVQNEVFPLLMSII